MKEKELTEAIIDLELNVLIAEETQKVLKEIEERYPETFPNQLKHYLAKTVAMFNVSQKMGRRDPISVDDITRAIKATLQDQQQARKLTDEELESMIVDQVGDSAIIGQLYRELRNLGVPYTLPAKRSL